MIDPLDLVTHSSDAALLISASQQVLAANDAARELLGRGSADKLDSSCDDLLRGTRADGTGLCCRHCEAITGFRGLRPYAYDRCSLQRADGSRFEASLRTIALPGAGADPERPVAIIFIVPAIPFRTASHAGQPRLEVYTLGHFALAFDESSIDMERWPRKQAVELLKLLVVQAGRPIHRERLIEHFWPDTLDDAAWARLKVTIHFLRQKLREAGLRDEVVETVDASYLLRTDGLWIDARAFEELAREGRDHQRAGRLDEAISAYDRAKRLYRGDFMEADRYAEWCAEERERLSEIHVELLASLSELRFLSGDFAGATRDCHAALVREPCRESVHRVLMRSLIALNRPKSAIAQFDRCRRVLKAELGVNPSEETKSILAPLVRNAPDTLQLAGTAGPPVVALPNFKERNHEQTSDSAKRAGSGGELPSVKA